MNGNTSATQIDTEYYRLDYDDELPEDYTSEHEKDSIIKAIRQDIGLFRRYCTPEAMAKATRMGFTDREILEICNDGEQPVKTFKRQEKDYLHIDSFLENFKEGLVVEDAPCKE